MAPAAAVAFSIIVGANFAGLRELGREYLAGRG
jgi:hypothetical protein